MDEMQRWTRAANDLRAAHEVVAEPVAEPLVPLTQAELSAYGGFRDAAVQLQLANTCQSAAQERFRAALAKLAETAAPTKAP